MEPFAMSRALAQRPDGMLSSGFHVKSTSPTTENGYENCTYTARIST